jgi:hypothetical protein
LPVSWSPSADWQAGFAMDGASGRLGECSAVSDDLGSFLRAPDLT